MNTDQTVHTLQRNYLLQTSCSMYQSKQLILLPRMGCAIMVLETIHHLTTLQLRSSRSHSAYIQHTKQITHEITTAVRFGVPSQHFVDTTHTPDNSEMVFCRKCRPLQERNCHALQEFCSMTKHHLKQFMKAALHILIRVYGC